MATRLVSKTELRERIRQELDDLRDDSLVITEHGQPIAVAVSVSRWNELQFRIEDLEDRLAILEHRAGKDRGRPAETVFSSIEAEGADVRRPHRKTG